MSDEQAFTVMVVVFIGVCVLALIALTVFVWFRILGKTGYSPWLAFLILVPLGNLVLPLVLAFSEWPISRELANLRKRLESA
jgi:hypothetical protein